MNAKLPSNNQPDRVTTFVQHKWTQLLSLEQTPLVSLLCLYGYRPFMGATVIPEKHTDFQFKKLIWLFIGSPSVNFRIFYVALFLSSSLSRTFRGSGRFSTCLIRIIADKQSLLSWFWWHPWLFWLGYFPLCLPSLFSFCFKIASKICFKTEKNDGYVGLRKGKLHRQPIQDVTFAVSFRPPGTYGTSMWSH